MSKFHKAGIFLAGILCGFVGAILLTSRMDRESVKPVQHATSPDGPYSFAANPEWKLYPPGTTLKSIYPDDGLRDAILHPDAFTIHRVDGDRMLHLEEFRFSSVAVAPTAEDATRLAFALGSMSSYEPNNKACAFSPAILLRIQKDQYTYELMFCFSCSGIMAEGKRNTDMSEQGYKTFLKCFCDTLPEFKELQEMRNRR